MPIRITIRVDTSAVKRALKALGAKAPKAIARAINRTAASTKTQVVRAIAADLAIPQRRIKENIKVDLATPDNLAGAVRATPGGSGVIVARSKRERQGRIPLYEFRARGGRGRRGGGVRYRLPGGRGVAPHAFLAQMKSTHKGVFQRIPGTQMRSAPSRKRGGLIRREKIMELFGPSIPKSLSQPAILNAVRAKAKETMAKNLKHEVDFLLSKQG